MLNQATMQGHTYLPYDKLVRQVNELLLIDVQDYDKYLMDLTMDKKIVVKVKDNEKCVYAACITIWKQMLQQCLITRCPD